MVLSNAIIVISVFVCRQKRSGGCCFLHNLRLYCLVLVEVHGKRAFLSTGRFFFFSISLCRSCLDALNILSSFFFFPVQILEPKESVL